MNKIGIILKFLQGIGLLVFAVVHHHVDKNIFLRLFNDLLLLISLIFIMSSIDDLRIYRIEEFLKNINLKSISSKEAEHLKTEISTLRWVVGLLSGLIFIVIAFLLNHLSINK